MKKVVIGLVVCFLMVTVVSTAKADPCEYHQWTRKYCKSTPTPTYTPPPRPERLILEGVYFDTGRATIKEESYSVLDRNADKLKRKDNVKITIVGYTDSVGSPTTNQKLSENRAMSVKNYFISRGISPGRINSVGRGESNPVASNNTATGRAQNRRIEIEIFDR